jgi:hypothetical protein
LPLPHPGQNTNVTFNGLIVDETATHGVLAATRPTGDVDEQVLVDFDPMTLSIIPLVHLYGPVSLPMVPLHFHQVNQPFDTVVAVSKMAAPDGRHSIVVYEPGETQERRISLNPFEPLVRCKVGVTEFSREPILTFSNQNREPSLNMAIDIPNLPRFPRLDDLFTVNFDIEAIPKFVADCITKYGLSEIERVCFPTRAYPVELAKIDILFEEGDYSKIHLLVKSVTAAMSNLFPFEWSVPLRVHQFPRSKQFKDMFAAVTCYDKAINFVARANGLPRPLISSVPQPLHSLARYRAQIIPAMAARLKREMPPLPLLRDSQSRLATVLTLVDIGDADGSAIFSALTGVPFTASWSGSWRIGSNFVPSFKADAANYFEADGLSIDWKKLDSFKNVICAAVKPDREHVAVMNVISIFTAMGCSDLVVVNVGKNVALFYETLKTLMECAYPLEVDYTKLFEYDPKGEVESPKVKPVKLAIVIDLGSNPEMKKKELDNLMAGLLAQADPSFTAKLFAGEDVIYVDAKQSAAAIANSIAQSLLVKLANEWAGFERDTAHALLDVENAAGFFGALLAYADYIMETGVDVGEPEGADGEQD